jgi:hypothetical protein
MTQQKFGVSVSEETGERLEELVDECTDLGAGGRRLRLGHRQHFYLTEPLCS